MRPIDRRIFLRNSALAMVGVGALPAWLQRTALAAETGGGRKKILVTLFQRGAADGLNIVVPHGESRYYDLRPSIGIARPSSDAASAIDLDGFFGLNPALSPLKPLWDSKRLAIVQASGSPDPTRSHFDAQDYMESGTPGRKATADGWLNRALPLVNSNQSPVRAVSLGPSLPRTMRGTNSAVAVESISSFKVRDDAAAQQFETAYGSDKFLGGTARSTFDAVKLLRSLGQSEAPGYPKGKFGESLRQIAQIIKADVGLEVAFADIGGWDHHVNEGPQLTQRLTEFGASMAAFAADLGDRMEDVVVVTMSEFGRTAKENGNRGTDHGHANAMFVMGGPVRGGKVYGQWPGLGEEQLYENRDLAVTTDFRDVLGEMVYRHLGNRKIESVFPGYGTHPDKFRGILSEA